MSNRRIRRSTVNTCYYFGVPVVNFLDVDEYYTSKNESKRNLNVNPRTMHRIKATHRHR